MRHLDIAERQRPNDKESRPTSRSALPIIDALKSQLCKKSVYVLTHRVIVVVTRTVSAVAMIECDNPDNLPPRSGIVTGEIEAIEILVGSGRRVFFIACGIRKHKNKGGE